MPILETALILPVVLGIDLQIQASQSSLSLDFETSIANSGNLTGNHDSETNPDGTITIPGLWGGGENQEIPITFDSGTSINGNSSPTGFMAVEPFDDQNLAVIHDLSMDLLSSTNIPVSLTTTLSYQSFHTENPSSVYPGGIPIELPLAELTLDSCLVEQTQSTTGAWQSVGDDTYTLTAVVPVLVTMEATYQGQPLPLAPVPSALAINGELEYTEDGPRLDLSLLIDEGQTIDLPGDDPLPPFPVSLPTIVPPGSFAEVLMTLLPESTSFALALNGGIVANAELETIPCDVTGDGVIDTNDVLAVLADWGPCTGCSSDTNDDDIVDVNDVLDVLGCWSD
ncbi:MAG: hypothetical protein CMJ40_02420 [Phycisphaerae bacterium]|nr:hypothetical protein [Phycisphaerae bacterium]|tara:strand:- start:2680 stop:3699 length:1020 start_codon:yes stop_codon:yes gene_type:complete